MPANCKVLPVSIVANDNWKKTNRCLVTHGPDFWEKNLDIKLQLLAVCAPKNKCLVFLPGQ